MAVVDNQNVAIPMPGMSLDSLVQGTEGSGYVQNLRWDSVRWGTRPGFGLLQARTPLPWLATGAPTVKAVSTLRTDAGKAYVVTLSTQQTATSILSNTNPKESQTALVWVLAVYDLEARSWMHTILTRRASASTRPLYDVKPVRGAGGWDINGALSTASVYSAGGYTILPVSNPDAPWSFAQAQDRLLMAHPDVGFWQVNPGLCGSDKLGIDSVSGRDCQSGFGESAWATPIPIRAGLEPQDYFTADEVGTPVAMAQYQGRTVLAVGRALFFSDAGDPAAYAEANLVTFLTETPIRAIVSVRNALLILTATETVLYVPSDGANPSAGLTTILSGTTGIVQAGQQAIALVEDTAIWVSDRGVHSYAGGSTITNIASGLANLWIKDEPIPNPLTAYGLTNAHRTNTTNAQTNPVQVLDLSSIYLNYEHRKRELYLCIPSLNRALVFAFDSNTGPQIGWWVFATQANSANVIRTTVTLPGLRIFPNPQVTPEQFTLGVTTNGNLYALGRGGGTDQTSHPSEDHDNPVAMRWRQETAIAAPSTANIACYYIGPCYRLPTGTSTPYQTTTQDVWETRLWVQVPDLIRIPGAYVDRLQIDITLDATRWRWLTVDPANPDLDYSTGAIFGDLQSGFAQMQAVTVGGVPDPDGIVARVDWQVPGAPPATGWYNYPNPCLVPHQWIEIARLRLIRAPGSVDTTPVNGFISQVDFARITTSTPTLFLARVYHGFAMDRRDGQDYGHDLRQQPVDWAYQTPVVGDQNTTMKIRGLWVRCRRSGNANTGIVDPSWPVGTTGWLFATNDRDLSSMEYPAIVGTDPYGVDFGNTTDGGIPTLTDTAGDPQPQVWGQTAAPPPLLSPKWGNAVGPQQGNVLVGTTPVGQWSCPSGGRGESVRYLLHGYIRGRAEYIRFQDATSKPMTLIVRPQADRKRRGGQ